MNYINKYNKIEVVKKRMKKIVDIIIYALCLGLAIDWLFVILASSTNDYWIVMYFNKANEFIIEVIILISIIVFVMVAYIGKLREGRRINRNIEIYE